MPEDTEVVRTVSAAREVAAPAAAIFELIAYPSEQPRWDGNHNLAEAPTGQRVQGVGDVFVMVLTNGATRENHVVEFDEGRRIAWRPADPGQPPAGHLWRWELEPTGDATTLVTHTYDWSQLTDTDRFARARSTTAERLRASLDRLASLAEDPSSGSVRSLAGTAGAGDTGRPTIHRLAAFTDQLGGGNPAGVVVTDEPLPEHEMLEIAAEVGYSETAFLVSHGDPTDRRYLTRYFAPEAEVSFCGHATIASAVQLGSTLGPGTYVFETGQGPVSAEVRPTPGGLEATLTSVGPSVDGATDDLVEEVLAALGWSRAHLDPAFVPAVAYAGARHLILLVATREVLADVDYDFDRLRGEMAEHDLTTVALLYRESASRFHARNLFPPGGVVEDPATGAAAAAFGAYLRSRAAVTPPATIEIEQGVDMGRPSRLVVRIPVGGAGIEVSGAAVALPSEEVPSEELSS